MFILSKINIIKNTYENYIKHIILAQLYKNIYNFTDKILTLEKNLFQIKYFDNFINKIKNK